jgi:hypothetical protein
LVIAGVKAAMTSVSAVIESVKEGIVCTSPTSSAIVKAIVLLVAAIWWQNLHDDLRDDIVQSLLIVRFRLSSQILNVSLPPQLLLYQLNDRRCHENFVHFLNHPHAAAEKSPIHRLTPTSPAAFHLVPNEWTMGQVRNFSNEFRATSRIGAPFHRGQAFVTVGNFRDVERVIAHIGIAISPGPS